MVLALRNEDYAAAAAIRDEMTAREMSEGKGSADGSWEGLGAPKWLGERLRQLDYVMPLDIQKRSMCKVLGEGKDALVVSQTGSGKTLSFLVPLLCSLDYSYFYRYYVNQILELEELEDGINEGGDDAGLEPGVAPQAAVNKPPPVQAVVVVPNFELGAQICLATFKLLGGNISSRRKDEPGDPYNMFSYSGPKGVDVLGMFTERDVIGATTFGKLDGVQILVGTPQHLAACVRGKGLDLAQLKVLAVDEFDACLSEFPEEMELLLDPQGSARRTVLCGATISDDMIAAIHARRWVEEAGDLRVDNASRVPSGTRHRYVVAEDEDHKLLAVTRLLRQDLRQMGPDSPPARVMVFAQNEETARKASPALRKSLWGEHKMTTLLPGGREPLLALQSFRDNRTTLMLATPYHCRGLDLPAVSHVYNLEVPHSPAAYIHQAGRTGRVGWTGDGQVVTIVTPAEVDALMALAAEVDVQLEEEPFPATDLRPLLSLEGGESTIPETEVAANFLPEDVIKNLEDVYNLFGLESVNAPEEEEEEEGDEEGDEDARL